MTLGKWTGKCVTALLIEKAARRVTAYLTPEIVVKATRQHRFDGRARGETFVVTIGRPNYRERGWIKDARKAGVLFPVKRLQFTFWPKRKK